MPDYNWITDYIFTVSEFFTRDECDAFIRQAESLGFGEAPINTSQGAVMAKDIRNNSRVLLDDPALALEVWARTIPFSPPRIRNDVPIGVNERFRFYRYDEQQRFHWHRDGCFERANGQRSRYTLMIYLNEDFEGGETRFEHDVIKPQTGTALFFLHPLLHEGAVVMRGTKYVLRTDVMYTG